MADVTRNIPLEPEHVLTVNVRQARLARVYAEALLHVATQQNQAEAVGDELAAVVEMAARHPQIGRFFGNPTISRRRRDPVLAAGLEGNTSPLVRNFIGVLNQNGRLGLLRAVAAAYRDLLDVRAGRVRVTVRSAVPLTDEQQQELRSTLAAALRREPVLDMRTDPNLLGGMVVQVGDKVYDTSVRARLEAFRTQLMARSFNVVA